MDLMRWVRAEIPSALLALQFLTRLPLDGLFARADVTYSDAAMKRSPGWYPAVGLVVGALGAVVFLVAAALLPQPLAALIAVAAMILITGALHEDGFADLCDGLGGGRGDKARALDIMRDSRIGTYGAVGLGLMLALRVTALALMPLWAVPFALIAGGVLSRASMVRAMAGADYARATGAGSAVAGDMADTVLQTALLSAAIVAVLCWPFLGFWAGIGGILGLCAAHVALRRLYEPRLGGYTGDCLGAVQISGEVGFLLGLMAGI